MNKKIFFILAVLMTAFLFVACEEMQEGQPKDVSYVPIDDIKVEDSTPPMPDLNQEELPVTDMEEETPIEVDIDEAELAQCSDGIDNDKDSVIDYPVDYGCDSLDDNNELNDGTLVCNNGLDDDNDGLVDEYDPGCDNFRTEQDMTEETPVEETPDTEVQAPKEIVIIVQETDLVNLKPVAYDPDKDTLKFTYSSPLDTSGQWKTTYGDMGEYTVTITASDGELTSSKDALLIVNKKEEAPSIGQKAPEEMEQEIDENTKIDFKIKASDLNKDPLTYIWKFDGNEVSEKDSFTYEADYNSAGSHTVKVDVSDGTTTVSLLWAVTVINVDRAPVLKVIPDITVKETETVVITPEASDPDGDEITYAISEPVGDDGLWKSTYDDSGVYTVKVTASDGELDDSQDVKVTVINVNRPPVIENILQVK